MKRIATATMLGAVAGLLCVAIGLSIGVKFTVLLFVWVVLNRTLIGFTIGISRLRLHWAVNGLLLGAVVGLLFSYSGFLFGSKTSVVVAAWILSWVYGFLIELFTTVVFKQPLAEAEKAAVGAAAG